MDNLNFYNLIDDKIIEDKEIVDNLESSIQKKINSNLNKGSENIDQIDFSSNKLKIGALIPLTGRNKIIGKEIMAGIENAHFSNFNN